MTFYQSTFFVLLILHVCMRSGRSLQLFEKGLAEVESLPTDAADDAKQTAVDENTNDLPSDEPEPIDPLEQFVLTSEQLLYQEQKKLDEFNVRSESLEEQVSFLKSTVNYLLNQLSQQRSELFQVKQRLEKLLKQGGGVQIKAQGVDGNEADAPTIDARTASDYGGTTYIRWGRNECPHGATPVYRGYAAGSWYNQDGGGSNYLCLHDTPQWNRIIGGTQLGRRAYIYGVEYQTYLESSPISTVNNGGLPLNDNDAPCVICHVSTRSTQLMIPGRRDCPVEWVKEYEGYLVTERSNAGHQRNSFVCLDEAPESVRGGQADSNGALFYVVESQCGSLPCPLYANGYEVTCVVCTKKKKVPTATLR